MICEDCVNSLISIRKNHLECLKCHMEIGKENLKYWEIIEKMPNYAAKHDKPEIINSILSSGKLEEDSEKSLIEVITQLKKTFKS